ncbi:hypothetical protein EYF80_003873 [Liparis tanakae]|uniref:Uncharacterized protein n=1 Tax=Liparis tanakae TaxID=230148 RepID=A0A4Z2J760_9TELE|nr:hypothetical protein EYF80_003873 [Liparis tanakae]
MPLQSLTRHSTQMPQNGPGVIGKDSEVPSMSEEERRGKAPGSLLKHMVMVFRAILKKLVKDTDFPCNKET